MDLPLDTANARTTRAGEVLSHEGDGTYGVIVMLEGSVIVTVGKDDSARELAIQRPRDLMAELNILTRQSVGATE
jgi:hypothetical protein